MQKSPDDIDHVVALATRVWELREELAHAEANLRQVMLQGQVSVHPTPRSPSKAGNESLTFTDRVMLTISRLKGGTTVEVREALGLKSASDTRSIRRVLNRKSKGKSPELQKGKGGRFELRR